MPRAAGVVRHVHLSVHGPFIPSVVPHRRGLKPRRGSSGLLVGEACAVAQSARRQHTRRKGSLHTTKAMDDVAPVPPPPPATLTAFLRKVNAARGAGLPELTHDGFARMLRTKDHELAKWMPVFRRIIKCKQKDDKKGCYSDQRKRAVFDEACALNMSEKFPYARCVPKASIRTADRADHVPIRDIDQDDTKTSNHDP